MKLYLRQILILSISFSIVAGFALFGDRVMNVILTPLPYSMKSCLSDKFSNAVEAQAACTGIANLGSVAVWDESTGNAGKIRESNVYNDYALGALGVGTSSPKAKLDVTHGYFRALDDGSNIPPAVNSGAGLEIIATGGLSYVQSYNRASPGSFQPLYLRGSLTYFDQGSVGLGITTPSLPAKLTVVDADNAATADIAQFYAQNQTQGIGIGYNSIQAVGSNATQDIFITPKGVTGATGGKVTITGGIDGSYGFLPNYTAWSAYGTGDGGAAIYNDSGSYQALMMVGNNSAGGNRRIKIYDDLYFPNGSIYFSGGTRLSNGGNYVQVVAPGGSVGHQYFHSGGTQIGYVYGDAGGFGLLSNTSGWALRIPAGTNSVQSYGNLTALGGILYTGGSAQESITNYGDGWLRLNQANSFANGVYTPYSVRVDGNVQANTMSTNGNITMGASAFIYGSGRLHMNAGENLYLQPYNGNIQMTCCGGQKVYAQGYNVGAAAINTYSLEVGGSNPASNTGHATIYFHHHGVRANQLRYNNGTFFMEAAGNGYGTTATPNLWLGGALSQNQGSDGRYKKNVEPLTNALDTLNKFNTITYEWKPEAAEDLNVEVDGNRHIGFIAQEVEKIFPDWIYKTPEGRYYIKDNEYTKLGMYALTIQAFKEIQEKISTLEKTILAKIEAISNKQNEQEEIIKKQQALIEKQQKQIESLEQRMQKLEK
jgi:hypothetical protein